LTELGLGQIHNLFDAKELNSTSFTDAGVRHLNVRIYGTYYVKTNYISHISYSGVLCYMLHVSPILVIGRP